MKTANPINTTNAMGKKRKRPKNIHKAKKDEENILSKDIDDDNIRYMMDTKKNLKPREDLKSSFTLKNLRFKPQKYKGSFLPYHLRWIFNNNVKTNEIVLLHEIEGLEHEINRLKCLKLVNRECRKISGLPFGITTTFCQCCHLFEKKKHDCSHKYCNNSCNKKKLEEVMQSIIKSNNKLKQMNNNNININDNNSINNSDSKEKNKNMSNEKNNININNSNLNQNEQKTFIINLSKNQPNKNLINNKEKDINDSEPKIFLGKKSQNEISTINNDLDIYNTNDVIRVNTVPVNRQLIFGVVRPSSREKRGLFMVQNDHIIEGSNTIYDFGPDDSSSDSNQIQINSQSEENNDREKINLNDKNNKTEKKEKDFEIGNYTVSIESDEIDDEPQEVIDINNENENEEIKMEKKENDKVEDNKDKSDEDDIIIINQTSPQNSNIEL